MTAPICAIDTETTGVHPDRQVWEVAMLRRDDQNGELECSFYVEVNLANADPFGLNVGRFYERHPLGVYLAGKGVGDPPPTDGANYLTPSEAAVMVARWTHGAHLVGAVPNFDADVLANLLRAHSLIPAWHYHLCDVEAMAVGWLHGQGWGRCSCGREAAGEIGHVADADCKKFYPAPELPWKSDELSLACGVEPPTDEERHTALGDARWCQRWFDAITGGGST